MRKLTLTVALLCLTVASLLAWSANMNMGGSADPNSYAFGVQAWANMQANWWTEQPTYVQVRVEGFGGSTVSCRSGAMDPYGYCAGNASFDGIATWNSLAEQQADVVPFGRYDGSSRFFQNNNLVQERTASVTFSDPPGGGEQGSCEPGYFEYQGQCWFYESGSPIVVATGKSNAYKLTSVSAGVMFDLDGDGLKEQIAWLDPKFDEVAFLALDRDGNGTIDSGKELFGDFTHEGVSNGFAALRETPGAGDDGKVTAADPLFASLVLWYDRNHDGYSDASELVPVSEKLEAIGLGYSKSGRKDGNGNTYRLQGWARKHGAGHAASREFRIYDVWLLYR